jgi:hypothetical protein
MGFVLLAVGVVASVSAVVLARAKARRDMRSGGPPGDA